ncbi:ABC transporter permease [Candidatus Enterococcus leclercqii]|uniref:ABC transporter permease n=1 Tax=Candidatus Enterococcus leclercqii TaxID=1857218 RepID=UPI001F1735C2|nr:ABC-2 family transporter protein [Enterococcus sp. CU9D]
MRLYMKYFKIHLASQMAYKLSFALTALGQFLNSFTAFLGVWFMFQRFHQVDGFSFQEGLLCFAVVLLAFSLAECFGRGFDMFPQMIANGEFDRVLVRPRSPIFQVLASKMEFTRIGRILQTCLIFAYALPTSQIAWSGMKVLTLVLMVLCGAVLFFFLFLIYAGITFFTLEGLEVMNIFTDGAREFGRYPFSVYGKQVLRFLTYLIPLAWFQYYPFLYLIGKVSDPIWAFSPLLCLLFGLPAYGFWRWGLYHYKSTGS